MYILSFLDSIFFQIPIIVQDLKVTRSMVAILFNSSYLIDCNAEQKKGKDWSYERDFLVSKIIWSCKTFLSRRTSLMLRLNYSLHYRYFSLVIYLFFFFFMYNNDFTMNISNSSLRNNTNSHDSYIAMFSYIYNIYT